MKYDYRIRVANGLSFVDMSGTIYKGDKGFPLLYDTGNRVGVRGDKWPMPADNRSEIFRVFFISCIRSFVSRDGMSMAGEIVSIEASIDYEEMNLAMCLLCSELSSLVLDKDLSPAIKVGKWIVEHKHVCRI